MENNRVMTVLSAVLAISCLIVGVVLISVKNDIGSIPDTAINDICGILAKNNIYINKAIISTEKENGTVYLFDSDGYNNTVAELLGGCAVQSSYVIPDGELIVLENGDIAEFRSSFSFSYRTVSAGDELPDIHTLTEHGEILSEDDARDEIEKVKSFLGNGSRRFDSGKLKIESVISGLWRFSEATYVLCSRQIDGVDITGNVVICAVKNGKVISANGTWCFFTPETAYSAQLTDILNILFNVKNDITVTDGTVRIISLSGCYSLFFLGDEESFCLIPCWQITTDMGEELIYNALDGTLYTRKSSEIAQKQ